MENASPKKTVRKKRKTHTTRGYRKREQEVQNLLREAEGNSPGQAIGLEALSEQFFHGNEFEVPQEKVSPVHEGLGRKTDEDSGGELAAEPSESPSRTFIQIDLEDPPVVWNQPFKQRHYYDESLLYRPSNTLHFQLYVGDTKLKDSHIRMLNRYQEQAKSQSTKLSCDLVAQLCKENPPRFLVDDTLYRTVCHKDFQSVFFGPMNPDEFQGLPNRRCLKLSLKQLRFSMHPQLLKEHQLAQQLEDLFDVYCHQKRLKICKKLREELEIARQVALKLLASAGEDQTAEVKRQFKLTRQLRQRYYSESAAQRNLLQRLLGEWAKLKELRRQQRFQCSRFQLGLRVVHPPDLEASYSAWKESFETDLAEVYREHLEIFYTRLRLWSEQNSRSRKSPGHSKPPRKPQFDRVMASLRKDYDKAFKDPEEPFVEVFRLHADEAAARLSIPGGDQVPRARNYFLKIFLDGQFVGQSRSYRLEPDLLITINECIGVLLDRTLPEKLNIWLYEKSTLTPNSRRLAQMSTALLLSSKEDAVQEKLSFQTSSSSNQLAGDVYLYYEYRTADGREGSLQLDDVQRLPDALRQTLLPKRLPALPEASKELVAPRPPSGRIKKSTLPPLIFAEQQLQFCGIEELLENRRFQLLYSRHQQKNMHTKQLRFVPALEQEISEEEQLPGGLGTTQLLEPGTYWNPIDLHKHRGRKFLQLLYEVISSHSARRAKAMHTPLPLLLLAEDADHSAATGWTALWRAICSVFQGQPTTLPREPPVWSGQMSGPDLFKVFSVSLHVVRATGVPVRSRHILNLNERRTSSGGDMSTSLFVTQTLMYSNVRPFVTLSYGQRLCRSRTAEGSNPTWNEQLQLQIHTQFGDLREDLKISLFDELIEQQYSDEASDVYQRVQCNWLGEFRVPINSLLASRKFEGCIEMAMPKVLVGYKRPLIDSVTNMSTDQYPEFKEAVHLWFYLSIEPGGGDLLPLQSSALACAEKPEMMQYLSERRLELLQLLPQPQRYVEPLVCTAQGKRVCLTRLLDAVPLPPAAASGENPLESSCRFVSLLSQFRSYDPCQGFRGVWLDNQALLDSTWCSVKDLGVLLCNYLLSLGLECWLILGVACPHGECSFVLFRQPETAELFLVSPSSGKRYQLQDVHCPLRRIFCIVGKQNIHFNIQTETRVSMTNFNLHDGACWFPLFSRRVPAPHSGVQKLDYLYKRSYDLSQLQKDIERKVMKKISAWRTTRKTIWNRAFQPRLQKILIDMENLSTFSRGRYDEPVYSEHLEREFPNYRLYGFTLNFAYTNLAAISERIRTTCIHYNHDASVEFCVAVHLHAHANDVLSVWLFLLSVVPLVV
ncbi:coiled-coil and C2 domain-containing protein 2A [Drosophila subpulchrella]|uniref:coiled-coil and C2 domain-containing protein 2A n=1 Tax=Drosophila subpulchrella TaxID=1486046 RepID=UPI0018A17124|nr:coiled-coil and C2 domain-containing protein 2A [Drosophila subpulchrella]